MASVTLSPQIRELLARLAGHPHGLGFLHLGELECISVTLEVHPRYIVAARELLGSPQGRAEIIAEFGRARRQVASQVAMSSPSERRERRDPPPPSIHGPEELIEAAKRCPLGLPFLLDAPFETVSITFQVCPHVVFAARELVAKTRRPPESNHEGKRWGPTS